MTLLKHLTHHDHLLFASVLLCTRVVVVRKDVLTHGIVATVERQHCVVEIDHVGAEGVDTLQHTVLELHLILLRRQARTLAPVPLAMDVALTFPSLAVLMALSVELLRVQALPPLLRAVRIELVAILLRQIAVILLRPLHPCPRVAGMHTNTQRQPVLLASVSPSADDVLLRTHVHRVPLLVRAVPQVEVVVMIAESEEISRTDTLVELHKRIGIPVLSLPVAAQFLQSVLALRTVSLDMVLALPVIVIVHVARIPVARLSLTLRTPVRPDAELSILKPFGTLPLIQTLPLGTILTSSHLHVLGIQRHCGNQRNTAKQRFFHIYNYCF